MKRLLRRIRPTKPLKELTWIDLFIITTILCGNAIYTSTMQWIASFSATEVVETGVQSFTAETIGGHWPIKESYSCLPWCIY